MRCALSFDENKELIDQELAAWGEMQSLNEDPAYKEEDIKGETDREYFFGYKMACDDVCHFLNELVDSEDISEHASEEIQASMSADLAMQLFSILDNQEEDDE